jgi:transposase
MKVSLADPRLGPIPADANFDGLTRKELILLLRLEHQIRVTLEGYVHELQEKVLEINGQLFRIRSKMFDPSSEKTPKPTGKKGTGNPKPRSKTNLLPSERYPEAEIVEKHITYETPPNCTCCGGIMTDSGMTEVSENLTVIPKKYMIVRQHRHKYRCSGCHGSLVTTPGLPRVVPGSAYSDELVVDATLSKYCDLIPMERYCDMAARQGFPGIPPHSLIGLTFKLAEFMRGIYEDIRRETLASIVLLADETPHRMLEGDERKTWFLWGFLGNDSCFYECHGTRSGDVASNVLAQSNCEVLLTDVYSGYRKAVREANELRVEQDKPMIAMAYCNSHARRGFKVGTEPGAPEAELMLELYGKIYQLEALAKEGPAEQVAEHREAMKPLFTDMYNHAQSCLDRFSNKSAIGKAFNYFIGNYEGLTLFLDNPLVPIDNNGSERNLRGPVVGRKTWYGTHSPDGAEAAAIHFSIIQSCKLIGLNPRLYYAKAIERLHAGKVRLTPKAFLLEQQSNSS